MSRSCDSRKYTYFFPTYLLIPPRPGSGLFYSLRRQNGEPPAHKFWDFLNETSGETNGEVSEQTKLASRLEELQRKRAWRIGVAELNALRAAVSHFDGTHNFHNFTVDKDFRDRSNQRHMKSIQVADPVVHGETEWISVLLHGQSFMLHQVFTPPPPPPPPPELNRPGVSHLTPKDRAYGFV
jgi:tRNA pseudouridine38-40 synthase